MLENGRNFFIVVMIILVVVGGSYQVYAYEVESRVELIQQNTYQPIAEFLRPEIDRNVQVTSVEVYGNDLYMTTRSPNRLYHFDITELHGLDTFTTYQPPEKYIEIESIFEGELRTARGLLNVDDVLYVYGNIGLHIFSLEDPNSPVLLDKLAFSIINLIHFQDYLIAPSSQGAIIFSVVDPASPEYVATLYTPNVRNFSAAVSNQRLYVSGYVRGEEGSTLSIFDLSDLENIKLIDQIQTDTGLNHHMFSFHNKLIGCGCDSVVLWSLTEPDSPSLVDQHETKARTCQILPNGNLVTNGDVFSVGDGMLNLRLNMVEVYSPTIDGWPYGATVAGQFVFLAQSSRVVAIRTSHFTFLPLILN